MSYPLSALTVDGVDLEEPRFGGSLAADAYPARRAGRIPPAQALQR
ncbi:MAG: hypothetical protein LBU50_06625 [Cellulomonas sp.]|jgi:hypothetical protein|nr:hypothetical protein [Cellulomonas sp.]